MAEKTSAKPALQFGKPEKKNWLAIASFWIFVICAIAVSYWLFHRNPRMHPLVCDTASGMNSLTGFGGCHDGG